VPTAVAPGARKAVSQNAAAEVGPEVALDVGPGARAEGILLGGGGEERLQVVLEDGVELRLEANGKFYVVEMNANPQSAFGEDFAESAERAGLSYEDLLQRILNVGPRWQPDRPG